MFYVFLSPGKKNTFKNKCSNLRNAFLKKKVGRWLICVVFNFCFLKKTEFVFFFCNFGFFLKDGIEKTKNTIHHIDFSFGKHVVANQGHGVRRSQENRVLA